jgi:glycolate oxidase FAD binding subunit
VDIVRPGSGEELAGALAECAAASRTITLGGAFSKNGMGGLAARADVTISMAGLNRVLQYEPGDLTISVEAGMPWLELTRLLAGNRQMIPLDPPLAAQGTVGGVVATNLSGPRRRLYGTARDMVIGMKFATLEGKLAQSGGMVVKNVAGLDMAKLLIGSFGTLAAMVSVNFKVTPAPAATRTFIEVFSTPAQAVAARDRLIRSVLQPAAVDVLTPAAAEAVGLAGGYALLAAVGGSEALLDRYNRELSGAEVFEGDAERSLWEAVEEFAPRFRVGHSEGVVVRFSHTLSALPEVLAAAAAECLVSRAASGVSYLCARSVKEAAAALKSMPARGVVEWAPDAVRASANLDLWPSPGDDFAMMEKIKETFDPRRLLNRGRLYGRI